MISCRARLVTMDETWLNHYDPETKQQWSSSPRSKKFRLQTSAQKVLALTFLDQDGILLIDYLPKGQNINAEYYSSLLGQLKDILKEKTPREGHQVGLVLARQCPGSLGTCNPEETGLPGLPLSWLSTLFSGYDPVGLPPVPWTEKTNERSPFFVWCGGHCCRGDLVGRTNFWIFFEWLAKVRATGQELYWASWGVCWINPEFGHCGLFPFWSA